MAYDINPMSRIDNCPRCRDAVSNAPSTLLRQDKRAVTVEYECRACRHTWTTSWAN